MTASVTKYQSGALAIGRAVDLSTPATIKVTLHTSSYTPNVATHAAYADLSNELATANGYTNGGLTLGSVTFTQTGGVASLAAGNAVWTASGAGLTNRYAVVRLSGTFNSVVDPLLFYYLLDTTPADVVTSAGNTLTVALTGGVLFTIT